MKSVEFTIYGDPVSLKRHRDTTVKTKDGRTIRKKYDPSSTDKQTFVWKAIAEYKPKSPIQGPIKLTLTFYLARPKSHFSKGKDKGKLLPSAPAFHISKPDLDNMVKFVKDALNSIYWKDDSQIYSLGDTKKVYTTGTPRTDIKIEF